MPINSECLTNEEALQVDVIIFGPKQQDSAVILFVWIEVAGQVTPGAQLARLAQRPQKDLADLPLALKA